MLENNNKKIQPTLEENLVWTLRRRMEKVEPDEVSWQVLHR